MTSNPLSRSEPTMNHIAHQASPLATLAPMLSAHQLYVRQEKEWAEILVDWETVNRYTVLDPEQRPVALLAERGGGLWRTLLRLVLRSHRPLHIDLLDTTGQALLALTRTFFWFWSDLYVDDDEGVRYGGVHRRFSIFYKKYDLTDEQGRVFAHIAAPFWRLWTFPLKTPSGEAVGEISKKWSGLLREAFTDADTFLVNLGEASWTPTQRAVILAAAISIDFDFFEENQGVSSVLGGLGN